ncbi:MAG: radical SAM protein [Candidatus Thermoplasmatota archaeon]|nr:radical SAM protein [Candidatus Thermoplasmatota archaeon]
MKSVYGPIDSWRLDRSLGVDLISRKGKACPFDCVYCQIKKTDSVTSKRRKFVSIEELREELDQALKRVGDLTDYLTFSGMGEPTLASNLAEGVDMLKEISDKQVAILTNGGLLYREDVREALQGVDYVITSLDAPDQEILEKVNRPSRDITFEKISHGLKRFSETYGGKLAVEIMVIEENKDHISEIARKIEGLDIDEVQLNTPLRPSVVPPVSEEVLQEAKSYFESTETKMVYEEKRTDTPKLDDEEVIKRGRPKG